VTNPLPPYKNMCFEATIIQETKMPCPVFWFIWFVFERDVIWRNINFKGRYNSCSNVRVKRIIRCILIKVYRATLYLYWFLKKPPRLSIQYVK
jgi:hypothetical protein